MLKEQFDRLTQEQKALISVSYLLPKSELWPEGSKKLFEKLVNYDKAAGSIQSSINQAKKTINELQSEFMQTVGSITAISGLIAECIPEEKFEEYCLKFEIPENTNMAPAVKPAPVDMAGSTAKQLPDPENK